MELSKFEMGLVAWSVWPVERSFLAHHAFREIPVAFIYSSVRPPYSYDELVIRASCRQYFSFTQALIRHYNPLFFHIGFSINWCHNCWYLIVFIIHVVFSYLQEALLKIAHERSDHDVFGLFARHVQTEAFAEFRRWRCDGISVCIHRGLGVAGRRSGITHEGTYQLLRRRCRRLASMRFPGFGLLDHGEFPQQILDWSPCSPIIEFFNQRSRLMEAIVVGTSVLFHNSLFLFCAVHLALYNCFYFWLKLKVDQF